MEFQLPSFVHDVEFSDGVLEGAIDVEGRSIETVFDPESEDPTQHDFDAVFAIAAKFREVFCREEGKIVREAAEDIMDESFADSHDDASESDYSVLEADLALKAVQFFPDGTMLIYESPLIFPKEEIVVQLTAEFAVDEVYFD